MADDNKELSAEELATLRPISVPPTHASSFRVQGTSNEFILMFQRLMPQMKPDGDLADVGRADTIAVISMSPQSVKDLSILLSAQIETWEKEFGKLETSFTRSQKKT